MSQLSSIDELLAEDDVRRLYEILQSMGSAAVAYSGGVDSTFLLRVAHEALGARARGVLAYSESLDRNEFEDAKELAASLGIPIWVVETHEYDDPAYRRNDANRCYHCKTELFQVVSRYAEDHDLSHVLDGSHAGDTGDYRPGLRARNEQFVRSPLMEAGLDKERIRELSRRLGLPTWDKPAAPCLASRIPYGSEVSAEKLRAIETAEKCLRDEGFRVVRVRHHGEIARIELPLDRIPEILRADVHARVIAGVQAAGFSYVVVDLEGFRSGNLNRSLSADVLAAGGAPGQRSVETK